MCNDIRRDRNTEAIQSALRVLEDFCWEYSLTDIKSGLWEWLKETAQNENAKMGPLFTLYESLETVVAAVFLLYEKKENNPN